eukprot:TRINITY_DN16716_c0_g1_i3.p1 TRINITY_DN16716_c0_g1~~TRINITY_DN16716_c0_g1_i3.p1  ORF type:complete len:366 (+),score=87.12 TRINITY_DN16716_c0_g1_i3:84-1181(+)
MTQVGRFRGDTTAVLSSIFGKVISIDREPSYAAQASKLVKDRIPQGNVLFLSADVYMDSWSSFTIGNDIVVAIIDAVHSFEAVTADIRNALRHCGHSLRWLVFDDWGMPEERMGEQFGVRRAVQAFEASGHLRCAVSLGLPTSSVMVLDDENAPPVLFEAPEGQVCEVLKHLESGSIVEGLSEGPGAIGDVNDPDVRSTLLWDMVRALSGRRYWIFLVSVEDMQKSVGKPWTGLLPHDIFVFGNFTEDAIGHVSSNRYGVGVYKPHLKWTEDSTVLTGVIRWAPGDWHFQGDEPPQQLSQQLRTAYEERGTFVHFWCLHQPGRFEAEDLLKLEECHDEKYRIVGVPEENVAGLVKRLMGVETHER